MRKSHYCNKNTSQIQVHQSDPFEIFLEISALLLLFKTIPGPLKYEWCESKRKELYPQTDHLYTQ